MYKKTIRNSPHISFVNKKIEVRFDDAFVWKDPEDDNGHSDDEVEEVMIDNK